MRFIQKQLLHVFSIYLVISFVSIVYAGGMQIKSGLWEIQSYITMPGGGTQERTAKDCIETSSITPEKLMTDDATDCEIQDSKVDEKSMTWTIRCQNQQVEMIGEGHAKSEGTNISGGMDISASYDGQQITMSTKWEGKYIGACN